MTVLGLAIRSLRNRMLTTSLTVGSIALSVALLVGVESVRTGVRQSFIDTIRGTDLIVGAKGGTIQLLLSSVFGMGAPAGGIPYTEYQSWAAHPAVKWTIPYSLGDSHRGYRVIGTTHDFYEHYRYRRDGRVVFAEGREPQTAHEAVLGADVARTLGYGLGRKIVLTHGLAGTGISDHENAPFEVVGVLARTFTPIDRAVYVTLEGIGEMHEGFGAEEAEEAEGRKELAGARAMPGAKMPSLIPLTLDRLGMDPAVSAGPFRFFRLVRPSHHLLLSRHHQSLRDAATTAGDQHEPPRAADRDHSRARAGGDVARGGLCRGRIVRGLGFRAHGGTSGDAGLAVHVVE